MAYLKISAAKNQFCHIIAPSTKESMLISSQFYLCSINHCFSSTAAASFNPSYFTNKLTQKISC